MPVISRKPLRDDVYRELLNMLYDRRLAPGAVLRDTELAATLGVSRTPVREALICLQQDGLVDADAGRGFRVSEMHATEVRQLYPILGHLEALALSSSPEFDEERIEKLRTLNHRLEVARTPREIVRCDDAWHEELLTSCDNALLEQLLRVLKVRAHRYEIVYMRKGDHVGRSVAQHAAIIGAIERDRISEAANLLVENWLSAMHDIKGWMPL